MQTIESHGVNKASQILIKEPRVRTEYKSKISDEMIRNTVREAKFPVTHRRTVRRYSEISHEEVGAPRGQTLSENWLENVQQAENGPIMEEY